MSYFFLVMASLLSCAGQLCQKQAATGRHTQGRWRHWITWLGLSVFLLGLALLTWLYVLQHLPVGTAYPMLSLNYIIIVLAARWLWKEPITRRHSLGILFIAVGIISLGLSR